MKQMLIDATSANEIRLAIVNDNKLENYEFEPRPSRYNKGNVYLAKVVRVEPALQAAFIEYADNTQGFLPFSEIHPDYYRIPVEDYEALMAEQRQRQRAAAEDTEGEQTTESDGDADNEAGFDAKGEEAAEGEEDNAATNSSEDVTPEEVTATDNPEDLPEDIEESPEGGLILSPKITRRYKIQEVIKRGQLMLVQVSKEERGNKRAALSTYIALAGCYCVLIPNALFNGGVSRKIELSKERKRLKKMMSTLDIPDGMALILRTAAEGRTKAAISRDLKYLLNLWDEMRLKTLDSVAPLLIHAEADLVNRSLRDIFSKQIEQVHIAGIEAVEQARNFTKQLNPRLTKSIIEHPQDSSLSLFESFGLEAELQQLIDTEVVMPSGGALVIEQTEALVSIDINSSKAIGERNIEETALKINLEAAEEIARQLRLRDLAGLIVIDFIDMEKRGNQQKVERTLKQHLKDDKARIHVGRISGFGLLEMSRQRLGPSILEKTTSLCPHCHGHGRVLNNDAVALALLRALRHKLLKDRKQSVVPEQSSIEKPDTVSPALQTIVVKCLPQVAQALINEYLQQIAGLETEFSVSIRLIIDNTLVELYGWCLEDPAERGGKTRREHSTKDKSGYKNGREKQNQERNPSEKKGRDKRRRDRSDHEHREQQHRPETTEFAAEDSVHPNTGEPDPTVDTVSEKPEDDSREGGSREKKRRRKRGCNKDQNDAQMTEMSNQEIPDQTDSESSGDYDHATDDTKKSKEPSRNKRRTRKTSAAKTKTTAGTSSSTEQTEDSSDIKSDNPKTNIPQPDANTATASDTEIEDSPKKSAAIISRPDPSVSEQIRPKRRGWWNIMGG